MQKASEQPPIKLVMPSLELASGKSICLHIPHGFEESGEALEDDLLQLAIRQSKSAAVSRPATIASGAGARSLKQSSVGWLSRTARISDEESQKIIDGLGEKVANILASNGGTPRCLLGLAATLVRKPEVLIYSTPGLDPQGLLNVHRFIAPTRDQLCVVHISYPTVFGDGSPAPRLCPEGAQCFDLTADFPHPARG